MMRRLLALLVLAGALTGCKAGLDDTVLPGKREDAIPGQSVFPAPGEDQLPQTGGGGGAATAGDAPEQIAVEPVCPDPGNSNDPSCAPDSSDDTTSADGTFSDGQ